MKIIALNKNLTHNDLVLNTERRKNNHHTIE